VRHHELQGDWHGPLSDEDYSSDHSRPLETGSSSVEFSRYDVSKLEAHFTISVSGVPDAGVPN